MGDFSADIRMPPGVQAFYRDISRPTGGKLPVMTPQETIRQAELRDAGDGDAPGRIVVGHARFIWRLLSDERLVFGSPERIEDVFSHALEGAYEAALRWTPGGGAKYPGYARWWIRRDAIVGINSLRSQLTVPWSQHDSVVGGNTGRVNSEALSVSLKKAVDNHNFVSLDAPRGDDGCGAIGDVITDPHGVALFDAIDDADESAWIWGLVDAVCTDRERTVLRMRFVDCASLEKIGAAIGLTRERSRQIVLEACEKLRRDMMRDKITGPFNWSGKWGRCVDTGVKIGSIVVRRYSETETAMGEVINWSKHAGGGQNAVVRLHNGNVCEMAPHVLEVIGHVAEQKVS